MFNKSQLSFRLVAMELFVGLDSQREGKMRDSL